MDIDPASGLLKHVEFVESPNCDDRPDDTPISLLVIHNISLPPNEFGGPFILQLFTNCLNPDDHAFFAEINHLKVSSHILIRRDGHIIQFVPFHKRAWHAGISNYQGTDACNNFSIGIELEGADEINYENIQYDRLVDITKSLIRYYPEMTIDQITGHCDIAPDRKTDPGIAFDWKYYQSLLLA